MNNARRKILRDAIKLCEEAKEKLELAESKVQECYDEEEECYDNLPETLQDGSRGEAMETAMSAMEDFIDNVYSPNDDIDELIGHLEEAIDV